MSVNDMNSMGLTALHAAANRPGSDPIIKYLVEKGAKIDIWNQKNKYGWTPLVIAEGVQRVNNIRPSPVTAAAIRAAMAAASLRGRQQ